MHLFFVTFILHEPLFDDWMHLKVHRVVFSSTHLFKTKVLLVDAKFERRILEHAVFPLRAGGKESGWHLGRKYVHGCDD